VTLTPLLLIGSALLTAFYGTVWQAVYSAGVPTGVASSVAQGLAFATLIAALLVCRRVFAKRDLALFMSLTVCGGLGGAVGSILGNAGGWAWLVTGAIIGGVAGSIGAVLMASRLGWIAPFQIRLTVAGATIGFMLASAVAVSSLSSPVGPLAASTIIGTLGVAGAWHSKPA
jgi:hypothetical protein